MSGQAQPRMCSAGPGLRPGPTLDLLRPETDQADSAQNRLGAEGATAGVDGDFAETFGTFLGGGIGGAGSWRMRATSALMGVTTKK